MGCSASWVQRPPGLATKRSKRRLAEYGPNDALIRRRRPLWRQTLDRLANPLILILLFASGLSAWTGEVTSFVIIVVIILLSVVLDVVQQARAENTVDALRRSVGLKAQALRDGEAHEIPVDQLVPGDVVELKAGDIVPGDCRLLTARDLFVNQAMLTGEPYPVEKHVADLAAPAEEPSGATNFVFMGTSVISGTATALVCRTGRATELGGLAQGLATERPRDAFDRGIRQFGFLMLRLTVFLVLFVVATNVVFHRPFLESLLFALALAVGLTPELLPMVVTVTLANGARRLAARRVIVKRLAAIHDLGAMDVLCTDKTGTLTESKIRLAGHVDHAGDDNEEVFRLAYLNSAFESGIRSPLDEAILSHQQLDVAAWQKIDEVPFDFERRRVSVLVDDGSTRLLVVKGAPEDIIAQCVDYATSSGERRPLDDAERQRLLQRFEALGEEGYRALGVASRAMPPYPRRCDRQRRDEADLCRLRHVCGPAEDRCRCRRPGAGRNRCRGQDPDRRQRAHHASHLQRDRVSGERRADGAGARWPHRGRAPGAACVGQSVLPREATAEGANPLGPESAQAWWWAFSAMASMMLPALHAADVGISVDTAADVAKEAADLVLLEHGLGVVHDGVIEGRRTVENVNKYILMGSSSNFGNMFSMAGAALFLPFLPMLPTQVLLNNLLYDVSEIGVPFDNVDAEALRRPVRWNIKFIERFMLVLGPVSSLFDFLTFFALLSLFGAGEAMFQTGWFIESLATQSLVIFVIRTRGPPWRSVPHPLLTCLTIGVVLLGLIIPLTPLGPVFGFVEPPPGFYLFLVLAVAAYLLLVEVAKQFLYRHARARPRSKFTHKPTHR